MLNNKKLPVKTALAVTLEELLCRKPFHKISVHELCETAKVSRSAFYANFEDKYHLLSYCLSLMTDELDILIKQYSTQEFLIVMLDFIQKKSRFFYNAFGAEFNESVAEVLYQFFYEHLSESLNARTDLGLPLPAPAEIIAPFYIGGLVTIIFRWIKSNYKLPKEEFASHLYRLIKDIL